MYAGQNNQYPGNGLNKKPDAKGTQQVPDLFLPCTDKY